MNKVLKDTEVKLGKNTLDKSAFSDLTKNDVGLQNVTNHKQARAISEGYTASSWSENISAEGMYLITGLWNVKAGNNAYYVWLAVVRSGQIYAVPLDTPNNVEISTSGTTVTVTHTTGSYAYYSVTKLG